MRPRVRKFVRDTAEKLCLQGPIYEFGSLQVERQLELANLRPIFPNMEYVGCDMRNGNGVDQILNLHAIDLPDETAGTVLCLETLEHVEFCRKAVEEMYRILKPNGFCIISSTMSANIHNYPSDYWRFTPNAFKSLLNCFESQRVAYAGEQKCPHTVFGIGGKGEVDWTRIEDMVKWI